MTYIEKPKRVINGYQPLANVLQDALDQAQEGKGNQRHANGKPFLEQPIITDGRACGLAGPAFQARKKILEALKCQDEERAVQDLLGAIVYTAAMVILKREEANHGTELWGASISEQDTRSREQAATSAQRRRVMDALASACGYTIPPIDDGDDWSGGKGQYSLERESQIVTEEVRAFGEQLAAKLNNTIICPGCGRRWPLGSEQGRSVSATGRCIVCRADDERATYTAPPPQDGDDDPAVHYVPDKTSRGNLLHDDRPLCPEDAL